MKKTSENNLKHSIRLILMVVFMIAVIAVPTYVFAEPAVTPDPTNPQPTSQETKAVTTVATTQATTQATTAAKKKKKIHKGKIYFKKENPKKIFKGDTFTIKPVCKYKKKKLKATFKYKSSNKKIVSVNKRGEVKGKRKGNAKIPITSSTGAKKTIKLEVKGTDKLIILTFDDGPSQYTPKLLRTMKKYDCHGTFFMVGYMAVNNRDILETMAENGNEPAIHSWNHPYYSKMSQGEVEYDIRRMKSLIKEYTGKKATLVRPPYGDFNSSTIAAMSNTDTACVMWNTDIEDWKYFNSSTVYNNIMNRVHPGAVLVIHDSHSWSVDAICSAIPDLKDRGYEFVSVSEYARIKGIDIDPGDKFYGEDD